MTDKATLMSVQVPETFESTAILADNFCTGVQDGHAEHSRDSATGLNKTWHPVASAENFREGAKFRHNRVTSQINVSGSAMTILGVSRGHIYKYETTAAI